MKEFKNAHLWLLIPFAIVMIGFTPSYWLKFADAPWRQHLHGLTATLWFVILVAQPYLITRGNTAQHRRYGMFALIVAGGVALSAYNVIPFTFEFEGLPDSAKYAFSFVDFLVIPGFVFAVVMAIVHSKNSADHARWMISTVFWALAPGSFRVMNMVGASDLGIPPPAVLMLTGVFNLVALAVLMVRDRRAHPAYIVAAIGSCVPILAVPAAGWEWWQVVADALFRM